MAARKSAAEVNGGRDTAAAAEIEALWQELKRAAARVYGIRVTEAADA
jgi:hypothetical protein